LPNSSNADFATPCSADSYALFYVYSYLHAEFSWDTDGSEDLAKRDVAEAWTVNDDNYGNSREATDINDFTDPNNCYFDGLTSTLNVTCVFDPDYTDTATEQPDHSDYQCDTTRTSGLPATIFGDMYGDFCNEADGKARTWLVDYKGNKRSRLARGFDKRTPPANPSDYKSALGYLSFEKKDGDAKCSKSCSDAFRYLKAGPCK
jgi:hypothetical protein